jgi:Spy/CpxP family protein refolding chaperone
VDAAENWYLTEGKKQDEKITALSNLVAKLLHERDAEAMLEEEIAEFNALTPEQKAKYKQG